MPAANHGGFAGLHDQVDTHLWEKFGDALILAGGSAGIQLSQVPGCQRRSECAFIRREMPAGSLSAALATSGQRGFNRAASC
jgi:type IV secretory pathway VirB10-like protein